MRILPAEHRPRYAEEFRAELWELGGQPRPRRRQLAHALRLVSHSVALRRGLASPAAAGTRATADD